jgi:hypothetical protein
MTESLNDKYLGLPALIGADRSDCFRHLIERVMAKTKGWKEKLLSMGGKEVLIKSIAQAVPNYAMMVFLLPKNICKGITDVISQFWWGDDENHRRMHWKAWWKLCIPKGKGAWDSGTSTASTRRCWLNKFGDYYQNRIHCVREC